MSLKKLAVIIGLTVVALSAHGSIGEKPKAILFTEMSADTWSQFEQGKLPEILIEFKQGDKIPLTIQSDGDLFETVQVNPSYLNVKRSFWLFMTSSYEIYLSLDGVNFKNIKDALTGTITAGASANNGSGIANGIQVAMKAYLK